MPESKESHIRGVYYCFSRQAFQEQVDMAAHRAKQLGNVHPQFRQPSVFHAHKHAVSCGGPEAWGECWIINPVTGEQTPFTSSSDQPQ